jgi:flavin reductase (DIM6/NTAB) family NADH-FMN oxidoreductase RutF
MIVNKSEISAMDQRERVHFVNSLSGFKSANLIGTVDLNGSTNLAIVSSVFHLGADPALMGMSIRPHSVPRDTLENILTTKSFTINHVNTDIIDKAHQTSARYPKAQSEFEAVGLTEYYIPNFGAPFVAESRLKIGLALVETQTLKVNSTELVIGEIEVVEVPKDAVGQDGLIAIDKLNSVAVAGLDTYFSAHRIKRLSYAKPDSWPTQLNEV